MNEPLDLRPSLPIKETLRRQKLPRFRYDYTPKSRIQKAHAYAYRYIDNWDYATDFFEYSDKRTVFDSRPGAYMHDVISKVVHTAICNRIEHVGTRMIEIGLIDRVRKEFGAHGQEVFETSIEQDGYAKPSLLHFYQPEMEVIWRRSSETRAHRGKLKVFSETKLVPVEFDSGKFVLMRPGARMYAARKLFKLMETSNGFI